MTLSALSSKSLSADTDKRVKRDSMACLPDCVSMVYRSEIERDFRVLRLVFPLIRIPCDLRLRFRMEKIENTSIVGSLEILPD